MLGLLVYPQKSSRFNLNFLANLMNVLLNHAYVTTLTSSAKAQCVVIAERDAHST
jgi:hypothetical protein